MLLSEQIHQQFILNMGTHELRKTNPNRIHLYKLFESGELSGDEVIRKVHDKYKRFRKYPYRNFAQCFRNTLKDVRAKQGDNGEESDGMFIHFIFY